MNEYITKIQWHVKAYNVKLGFCYYMENNMPSEWIIATITYFSMKSMLYSDE